MAKYAGTSEYYSKIKNKTKKVTISNIINGFGISDKNHYYNLEINSDISHKEDLYLGYLSTDITDINGDLTFVPKFYSGDSFWIIRRKKGYFSSKQYERYLDVRFIYEQNIVLPQ